MRNKKGLGREITFLVAFIIIVMTAVAIAYVVIIFNSKDYGVGDARAEILGENLGECLSKNKDDLAKNPKDFDLFSKCMLNKDSLEQADYYFGIFFSENNKWVEKVFYGDGVFRERCEYVFLKRKSNEEIPENYPSCYNKEIENMRIVVGLKEKDDTKTKKPDFGEVESFIE